MELNLEFYTGVDLYSDGVVEDQLLSIVKNKESIHEVLTGNSDWAVLYHLSPLRRNLLEWYHFKANARILEVGAGCGALTGLLCEKGTEVTAVELSKKRAQIIAERHREATNLEIIVGNLKDIKFKKKYDYITLIGVLEYAGQFIEDSSPYERFLDSLMQLLKPDGTLIIAIENRYGLKYWSGASEDHTGNVFEGLENYPVDRGVRTFSKKELESVLEKVGFRDNRFYYPMPDYKLPTQVFSDKYLPRPGDLRNFEYYDRDRLMLFNEKLLFDGLSQNEAFSFFSNSFLVFSKL
ncbi:class I SAM-dependent methyltransferase [Paenibacillus favisporus]|uniref:class I SAM-dependent methyltransferase n=1 Tax=Paenibacillus favisporus TaxID=221028 RepID=UPI003D2735E3